MKNKVKLQEQGIKDTYIYSPSQETLNLKLFGVRRDVTCLLIKDRQVVARGHSRCSAQDQFVKKEGRNIALGKAIQAFEAKYDTTMAEYTPVLFEYEQEILAKIIEHEEKQICNQKQC